MEYIQAHQFDNDSLKVIQAKMLNVEAKKHPLILIV